MCVTDAYQLIPKSQHRYRSMPSPLNLACRLIPMSSGKNFILYLNTSQAKRFEILIIIKILCRGASFQWQLLTNLMPCLAKSIVSAMLGKAGVKTKEASNPNDFRSP